MYPRYEVDVLSDRVSVALADVSGVTIHTSVWRPSAEQCEAMADQFQRAANKLRGSAPDTPVARVYRRTMDALADEQAEAGEVERFVLGVVGRRLDAFVGELRKEGVR